MIAALRDMIALRSPKTLDDHEQAFKEVLQQCILLGLQQARFFEKAAFYGGTALRLFHGLERFSEDLDFSLLIPNDAFTLTAYFDGLKRSLASLDLSVEISTKKQGPMESAFLKANTQNHLVETRAPETISRVVPANRVTKVRFEVDTQPPVTMDTEARLMLSPYPFSVRVVTLPHLFAGKLHACLCRAWKSRVKGRDWYDLLFFVQKSVPVHRRHLTARLRQTGHWTALEEPSAAEIRHMYESRVRSIDWNQAAQDVRPFIKNQLEISAWSQELFVEVFDHVAWL